MRDEQLLRLMMERWTNRCSENGEATLNGFPLCKMQGTQNVTSIHIYILI